jgi:ABC-type nickel/cobalt efflux system permease component RcnA
MQPIITPHMIGRGMCIVYNYIRKVQFDLLKYLLSELHSGSRRLIKEFPEHLIIAGSLCDLHHPANLPTVERQWRHNHAHKLLSRSRLLLHSTVVNCNCSDHHQEGGSSQLVLVGFAGCCIPCSAHMRLCSIATLGGPDPFLTFMCGVCFIDLRVDPALPLLWRWWGWPRKLETC